MTQKMIEEKAMELIKAGFVYHYEVDDDCWYSCPMADNYCGEDEKRCTCCLQERAERLAKHVLIVELKARIEELNLAHGKTALDLYHRGIPVKLEWIEHKILELKSQLTTLQGGKDVK